ncbi:MAG: hypothetical protein M1840_004647 [Geoglossum simile]|nr:MAG: hypothetical protein M1840_004647 [Geoglossum simile]
MFSRAPAPRSPPMIISERRPTFFISRGDGTFTPLIPADELPANMAVLGAPRVMSFAQTIGMTSVGEVTPSGLHYQVKLEEDVDQRSGARHPFVSPSSHAPSLSPCAPDTVPIVISVDGGVFSAAQGFSATSILATPTRATSNLSASVTENPPRANPSTARLENQQSDRPIQRGTASGGKGPPTAGIGQLGRDHSGPTSQVTDMDPPRRSLLSAQVVGQPQPLITYS